MPTRGYGNGYKYTKGFSRKKIIDANTVQRMQKRLTINNEECMLTGLQKEAFRREGLWYDGDSCSNVMIQGATSSGKTLVAEVMAANILLQRKNLSVIFLVPLKAMVGEKVRHLSEDLGDEWRIFGSSADFQENDEAIINSSFDIAVIVYEKFFALMSYQTKMLEGCSMVIVDEIQMISSKDRGPKLEFALMKLKKYYDSIRIVGITTCDCNTDMLCSWLEIDEDTKIVSTERPVGLKEYIVNTDGRISCRITSGERDTEISDNEKDISEDKIAIISKNERNIHGEKEKSIVLKAILEKIYGENRSQKVIIYTDSKSKSVRLARRIRELNLFPFDAEFRDTFDFLDVDENVIVLQKECIPFRVAFHNGGLPVEARSIIESSFEEKDGIAIIVATETLMVGLNMPVDTVILYDGDSFKGGQRMPVRLSVQSYKNFVGRAGRLGLTNGGKGSSYLITCRERDYKEACICYLNPKTTQVVSGVKGSRIEDVVPYYMSFFNEGKELIVKELRDAEALSFYRGKSSEDRAEEMLELLCKAEMARSRIMGFQGKTYALTVAGKVLAPYALSLFTCYKLKQFFRDGKMDIIANDEEMAIGGLRNVAEKEIRDDTYILDILYLICSMDEVAENPALSIPGEEDRKEQRRRQFYELTNQIQDYLKRDNIEYWEDSGIETIKESQYVEHDEWTAAFRAILLSHWIRGETMDEIKMNTGIKATRYVLGDFFRLSEVCSYLIEAASRVYGKPGAELYRLSRRVKYGVGRDLIKISNRRINGIGRSAVIQLGKASKEYARECLHMTEDYDVLSYIRDTNENEWGRYIKPYDRERLLRQFDKSFEHGSLSAILENMNKEDNLITEEMFDILTHIGNAETEDMARNSLEILLSGDTSEHYDKKCAIARTVFNWILDGAEATVIFSQRHVCNFLMHWTDPAGIMDESGSVKSLDDELESGSQNIVLWNHLSNEGEYLLSHFHTSLENFAMLVAQCIAEKKGIDCGSLLYSVLCDMRGKVIPDDKAGYWHSVVKKYARFSEEEKAYHDKTDTEPLEVLMIYDDERDYSEIAGLKKYCSGKYFNYDSLQTGQRWESSCLACIAVVFANSAMLHSRCLVKAITEHMTQNGQHLYFVFGNNTSYREPFQRELTSEGNVLNEIDPKIIFDTVNADIIEQRRQRRDREMGNTSFTFMGPVNQVNSGNYNQNTMGYDNTIKTQFQTAQDSESLELKLREYIDELKSKGQAYEENDNWNHLISVLEEIDSNVKNNTVTEKRNELVEKLKNASTVAQAIPKIAALGEYIGDKVVPFIMSHVLA